MVSHEQDNAYMQRAIALAKKAAEQGEVPVGAVLVYEDRIIAEAYNSPIETHDPSAHAEINVLRQGARALKNYRLLDSTLYVTLEPCVMCAGAIIHARVKRVVYGAKDPKAGAHESLFEVLGAKQLNHYVAVTNGVLADECSQLLKTFFAARR